MSDDQKETPPAEDDAIDKDASTAPGESESSTPKEHDSDPGERSDSIARGDDDPTTAKDGDDPAPGADDASAPAEPDGDDGSMRALLRGAFEEEEEPQPRSDVLRGVQDKLRKRSGGKFYADGWSTARHPPTMTYLWTSVIMLAVVVVAYAVLASLGGEAKEVPMVRAPVQFIFH